MYILKFFEINIYILHLFTFLNVCKTSIYFHIYMKNKFMLHIIIFNIFMLININNLINISLFCELILINSIY